MVVCTASDFFRNACRFVFGKEAENNKIDLSWEDPQLIRRMVLYCRVSGSINC
ncbi:hypothetical protein CC78DRAFT_533386 [Lojkania enalia]|uniref:BTB domain-containing protein n=1 Tax=Lojkania enalia TaxID=147567 RepID=A0A9P4KCU9_9PLEO|nr:hypothetical protein CC78DRAFT_533386 [Didymosphaeria enalia]